MATIRSISKKIASLILDTDLATIGKKILKWLVLPVVAFLLLGVGYDTYQNNKRLTYCSDRGVSESQCDYFIEYGD
ncbi:hypothetical protein [Pseudoalteromonas sp. JB197]|uniref:hypothetical protein n=1 Tax=Pseudoalteromonas sp. JB197 TaxID=1434839 RepID=UPI000B35D5A6|nr:hypothetical protein [Pseudoalteromonas sp. JB197]PCC12861.1 hypothetical protein CIK86_05985 [Pseudoalteromonas sp. JB197]